MVDTKVNNVLLDLLKGVCLLILTISPLPALSQDLPIRYVFQSDSEGFSERALITIDITNRAVSEVWTSSTSLDAPNFIFLHRKNAIIDGTFNTSVLGELRGEVLEEISESESVNDFCYFRRFTLFSSGDVVVGIANSNFSQEASMMCLVSALHFLFFEDTRFSQSFNWRDRLIEAIDRLREENE